MLDTAFPAAVSAISLWGVPAEAPPLSGAVVAVVLQFGDLWETRADGATLIRLSPERALDEDVSLLLGEERARALDVSLVWDEARAQLMQVVDAAPLRAGSEERRRRLSIAAGGPSFAACPTG